MRTFSFHLAEIPEFVDQFSYLYSCSGVDVIATYLTNFQSYYLLSLCVSVYILSYIQDLGEANKCGLWGMPSVRSTCLFKQELTVASVSAGKSLVICRGKVRLWGVS